MAMGSVGSVSTSKSAQRDLEAVLSVTETVL